MADTTNKLRRLAEVEFLRAEIEARRAGQRILIIAIAVLVGMVALCFLTFGLYLTLAERYGAINAAFIIGAVLTLIAATSLVLALKGPSRSQQLESEILTRNITEARDDLREDIDALERRIDQVSSGLTKFLDGRKPGDTSALGGVLGGNANLAAITLALNAIAAMSPTLNRYIQPILKIIS